MIAERAHLALGTGSRRWPWVEGAVLKVRVWRVWRIVSIENG